MARRARSTSTRRRRRGCGRASPTSRGDITDPKMYADLVKKIDALTKGKGHKNVVFLSRDGRRSSSARSSRGSASRGPHQARRRPVPPHHHREAIRHRSQVGARAGRADPEHRRRGPDLPYRPFPRQGDGAEHHGPAVRELHVRADLEPRPYRQRANHRRRDGGRGNARKILRQDRRDAGHGAEPHVPAPRDDDDGSAELLRRRPRSARKRPK